MRVRCPQHEAEGAHSPSLAIWEKGGGQYAFRCLTGCPHEAVAAAIRARGVPCGAKEPVGVETIFAVAQSKELRRVENLEKAKALLEGATTSAGDPNSPAGIYLRSRHLVCPSPWAMFNCQDPAHPGGVGMLAPIVDLTTLRKPSPKWKCTGISILSLMPDGTPRLDARGKKFRSIIGTQSGYAVPLGVPKHDLVVGEGVETTIAAMQLLGIGFGAAVLSASNMAPLAVPEWIGRVVIAADNDEPGLAAAKSLKLSLTLAAVRCSVVTWGDPGTGWDAADQLMKEKG